MKKIWKMFIVILSISVLMAFAGCRSVAPEIVPDTTGDSVILLDIKSKIEQGKEIGRDNSWLWWYAPVLFLIVAWGVKEFFIKKEPDDCDEDKDKKELLTEENKPE